jgi:multicomponent Na+:H+ antiporter subunit F
MENYYVALAFFLLFTLAAGLVRVVRGPRGADRMLGAQLLGTTGVAILLVLARAFDMPALRDAALLLALLAVLAVVTFVHRAASQRQAQPGSGR